MWQRRGRTTRKVTFLLLWYSKGGLCLFLERSHTRTHTQTPQSKFDLFLERTLFFSFDYGSLGKSVCGRRLNIACLLHVN